MRYRVDTVPLPVRIVYVALSWTCGLVFFVYYWICRVTSEISIAGPGKRDLSQHAIFCLWHESWWPYFVAFLRFRSPHAIMSHPAAYMKPVHVVFRLMGGKMLLLGSSGDEGKLAADALAWFVHEGHSTTISPDGPHGPARVLKKGVLHIAAQSGVPIVPLSIASARYLPLPTWDSKRIPLPFNRIVVTVHEAVPVTLGNFQEASARIVGALARSTSGPSRPIVAATVVGLTVVRRDHAPRYCGSARGCRDPASESAPVRSRARTDRSACAR